MLAACRPGVSPANGPIADLILENGAILTMDPGAPRASAVAIADGHMVYVGDDASPFRGPKTRVIDLAGRSVVPALTDAHTHLAGLGFTLGQVALEGCSSADECASRLRGRSEPFVQGRGWDQNRFPDASFPDHGALDRVVADRPVWLRRVDGHAGWANARALELAKIDRTTPDPAGGRILHDASGEPTGVLVDNAMELVGPILPRPSDTDRERAILLGARVAVEHGLTEVHEMGIDDATIAVYRRLASEKRLPLRVSAYKDADAQADRPDEPRADAFFTLRGIKLYADGALGSRGAALLAPYDDDRQNIGLLVTPPEVIEAQAKRGVEGGWQLAVHAIGDRANRSVLDAFEHAGATSKRFRIEHAQVLASEDIPRFRALGVIASMQPTHATSDQPWAETRLGKTRMRGAYAWQTLARAGTRIAFGSDAPVEDIDPLPGLRAAVLRTLPEHVTLDAALRGFTSGAAYAAFEEGWRGHAAAGQAADLTVFDRDLSKDLDHAQVAMTIVGGSVAFVK